MLQFALTPRRSAPPHKWAASHFPSKKEQQLAFHSPHAAQHHHNCNDDHHNHPCAHAACTFGVCLGRGALSTQAGGWPASRVKLKHGPARQASASSCAHLTQAPRGTRPHLGRSIAGRTCTMHGRQQGERKQDRMRQRAGPPGPQRRWTLPRYPAMQRQCPGTARAAQHAQHAQHTAHPLTWVCM